MLSSKLEDGGMCWIVACAAVFDPIGTRTEIASTVINPLVSIAPHPTVAIPLYHGSAAV